MALSLALTVVGVSAQVCLRLDGKVSPVQYNHAWNQYLPTRFEFSQESLGDTHLRFVDGVSRIVMILGPEDSKRLVTGLEMLLVPRGRTATPSELELSFEGWFQLGPRWYRTGEGRARAYLSIDPQGNPSTPYRIRISRLVALDSPFMTYQPGDLLFNAELLQSLGRLVSGSTGEGLLQADFSDRACGFGNLSAALYSP